MANKNLKNCGEDIDTFVLQSKGLFRFDNND